MKLLAREIANFYRFFWKIPPKEKGIVFFAEHKGYYPYFEGIIHELINKHKKTICYITGDSSDPILSSSHARIKPLYFNKLLPYFMSLINCKILIMTLTDLNQFYIRRSISPVHYVYMFHALMSTHMIYLQGAFDHYDTIFCPAKYHIRELRQREKITNLRPKNLVEAGYYRLERIYKNYKKYQTKTPSSRRQTVVLVAPSWGTNNLLKICGVRLVNLLLDSGYKVIVRPHPETFRRSPTLITTLDNRFGKNSNFILERSVENDDSMLNADFLITDYSGIALEFAFGTERPVIFIDVPYKIRNDKYLELGIQPFELSVRSKIGVVVSPNKLDSIHKVIEGLIKTKSTYKSRIERLRHENIFAFGESSKIGARHIINLCDKMNRTVSNEKNK